MKRSIILVFFVSLLWNQVMGQKDSLNLLKNIEPYGSFQIGFGGNRNGWSVVNLVPRVGLKGSFALTPDQRFKAIAKAEFGLRLVQRDDRVTFSADPGSGVGSVNSTVFIRQGFVGVETPYGNLTFGKQWGVHYFLAGNIDNMYLFGGDAIGVYNAGTDGGPSGTGRADQAVKYELKHKGLYLGLLSQFRSMYGDVFFFDSYSAAVVYQYRKFLVGTSYSKVLDGLENPIAGEPKINDELFSILLDYNSKNFQFGIISGMFTNHETMNDGTFFSGFMMEYNLKYYFKNRKWAVVNNSSIKIPNNNHSSEYFYNVYDLELARRFSPNVVVICGVEYDNSTLADGSHRELFTLGFGFYYNFNQEVP